MTDYIRDIGGSTTLMIRDLENGWVEFWVKTGSRTYNNQQRWSYSVGGYSPGIITFRMASGGNWQMAGNRYYGDIGLQYTIGMSIQDAGLGFPSYGFEVYVQRARPPDPPGTPYFGEIEAGRIHVAFDYGYNGGMGIDAAQVWYSDDPNWAKWAVSGRDVWVGGLVSGGEYFFWGQVHNSIGWSGLGGRSSRRTLRIPDAPNPVQLSEATQTSVRAQFVFNGWDGGTGIREWQVGYGTDPNYPQFYFGGYDGTPGGLQPGQRYYFWARGRNDVGWGYWSARSEVVLIAGAWVNVGGTQRRALPWVKQGGAWKLATPWTKAGGTWKVPFS